jgi:hypothetical protein
MREKSDGLQKFPCDFSVLPEPGGLGVVGSNPAAPTKFHNDFRAYLGLPVCMLPPVFVLWLFREAALSR